MIALPECICDVLILFVISRFCVAMFAINFFCSFMNVTLAAILIFLEYAFLVLYYCYAFSSVRGFCGKVFGWRPIEA